MSPPNPGPLEVEKPAPQSPTEPQISKEEKKAAKKARQKAKAQEVVKEKEKDDLERALDELGISCVFLISLVVI